MMNAAVPINNHQPELDSILRDARQANNFAERVQWITALFSWLQKTSWTANFSGNTNRLRALRFKFFISIMEKNSEDRDAVVKVISALLNDVSFIESLGSVGFGHQMSVFQELNERIIEKLLPNAPIKEDFTTLLLEIFPDLEDIEWLAQIDEDSLKKFENFFYIDDPDVQRLSVHINESVKDAIVFLVSQIHAFGLSNEFRRRSPPIPIRESPFYRLLGLGRNISDTRDFTELCKQCDQAIDWSKTYLDENGISVSIIYRSERARCQIDRLQALTLLLAYPEERQKRSVELLLEIVKTAHNSKSISHLFSQNFQMLSLKVVDRNSEIGEHYKASTYGDALLFLKRSAGGGLIVSATVLIKAAFSVISISPFINGVLFSLNYSLSFLLIHFCGFTLATKQPASTAAAIASKIQISDKNEFATLVDEIIAILRAQSISIIGNLILVGPCVAMINFVYFYSAGKFLVSKDTAHYLIHSSDILGPSAIFAAFTGTLLFLSSLIAGWVDNWFIYRNLDERILNHVKLGRWLGTERLKNMSQFLRFSIAALAANISLGFLLGLLPLVLQFFGLPIEVRHVTLSMGSFALGLSTLFESFTGSEVVRASIGILVIGILNVSVSFYCAFRFAAAAKRIKFSRRKLIYWSVIKTLLKHPMALIFPPRRSRAITPPHS
ncbi:MAG: site-specific recombinase [Bdellovibrionales bacterium]|nr:site-specific recombinase [Bdellovibrionales bacterium]